VSQEIGADQMVSEFYKLKDMDQTALFELLGIAHLFKDDVQKEEKLKDLYSLITGMVERKPAMRRKAVDLLKLKCFEEAKVLVKEQKEGQATTTTGSATTPTAETTGTETEKPIAWIFKFKLKLKMEIKFKQFRNRLKI